jgi:hypothetical protein
MTPVMPLDEALTRLQQQPLGKATYARVQTENGRWETAWLIRDEARRLTALGPTPAIECRAGAFDEEGVGVLPILMRFSHLEQSYIYDTCLDAAQVEGENVFLQDLARQDRLHFQLYDESGQLVRTLTTPNSLRDFAQGVLQRLGAYQPATQAAFAYARERFYANYTEVHELWQALARRS